MTLKLAALREANASAPSPVGLTGTLFPGADEARLLLLQLLDMLFAGVLLKFLA
jgi:hypothetical protein